MPKIAAVIIESAVFVLASWALVFLSTLLHEIGHALGYMIASGDRRWHIRVGWGKCLIRAKVLTVNLIPFDGFFTPLGEKPLETKAKKIAMLAGGPAVSLLIAAALLPLKIRGIPPHTGFFAPGAAESFVSFALFCNLFILIQSVLPIRYLFGKIKGLESDGLQIVRIIKSRE